MNAKYKFKTGETVEIFVWDDMLDSNPSFLRTNEKINGKPLKVLFDNESKKKYFIYKGEQKYFEDFEYPVYEDVVKNLSKYKYDEILACLLKEADKICIIANTKRITELADLCSSDEITTLMVPIEGRYNKSQWHYKIEFEPLFNSIKDFCANHTYYFTDFFSLLIEGYIKLVNKEEIIEKIGSYTNGYKAQIEKERENLLLRIISNIKRKTKKYNYSEQTIVYRRFITNLSATSFIIQKNTALFLNYEGILIPVLD